MLPLMKRAVYQLRALLIGYAFQFILFFTDSGSLHALQKSFPNKTFRDSLGYSLIRVEGETWGSLATAPLVTLLLPARGVCFNLSLPC